MELTDLDGQTIHNIEKLTVFMKDRRRKDYSDVERVTITKPDESNTKYFLVVRKFGKKKKVTPFPLYNVSFYEYEIYDEPQTEKDSPEVLRMDEVEEYWQNKRGY